MQISPIDSETQHATKRTEPERENQSIGRTWFRTPGIATIAGSLLVNTVNRPQYGKNSTIHICCAIQIVVSSRYSCRKRHLVVFAYVLVSRCRSLERLLSPCILRRQSEERTVRLIYRGRHACPSTPWHRRDWIAFLIWCSLPEWQCRSGAAQTVVERPVLSIHYQY